MCVLWFVGCNVVYLLCVEGKTERIFFLSLTASYPFCTLVFEKGKLHNRQIWPEASRATKLSVLSPQIRLLQNNLVFLPVVFFSCLSVLDSSSLIVHLSLNCPVHSRAHSHTIFLCPFLLPCPLCVRVCKRIEGKGGGLLMALTWHS